MDNKSPIGHRKRLRSEYIKSGTKHLPPTKLVELLLFYALPRRDTKPVASALLQQSGSLEALFAAPPNVLTATDGTGSATRDLIALTGALLSLLREDRLPEQQSLSPKLLALKAMAEDYYADAAEEQTNLLLLDNAMTPFTSIRLSTDLSDDMLTDALNAALQNSAAYIVVLANRCNSLLPTDGDLALIRRMNALLYPAGITLYDYLIVCQGGSFSLSADFRYCRLFNKTPPEERPLPAAAAPKQ